MAAKRASLPLRPHLTVNEHAKEGLYGIRTTQYDPNRVSEFLRSDLAEGEYMVAWQQFVPNEVRTFWFTDPNTAVLFKLWWG
ncbi:MAG: hypothetical protein EOP83_11780 [Verrucomicrobiaceae bacterium]|nr:MAG: hypothetical protein EOP83_11780 [Verrucomicrobiaceae bacterium]